MFKGLCIVTSIMFFLGLGMPCIHAAEVNHGLVVIDKAPWKTSWIQEGKSDWRLISWFDKGKLTTHFKHGPKSGLGIDVDNQPTWQAFEYYPTGKTYKTKNVQFEQWPDGAKAHAALYDEQFQIDGVKYQGFTTAIIQEVNGAKDEIRYSYLHDLN